MEDSGFWPLEDNGFRMAQPPAPRRRGHRGMLLGGLALAFALALGVGGVIGSALGSNPAQAASSANPSQAASSASQPQAFNFGPGRPDVGQGPAAAPGAGSPGQCVALTVTSVSGSTIVAKASDGSSVTIHTTSSTKYTQHGQSVAASAVTVGARISVMGTHNSDGSITATSIDILG